MRSSIHRAATTVAVLFHHRPVTVGAFSWGNRTSIWNQLNPLRSGNSRMSSRDSDVIESDRMVFYKLDSTESTQDEARRLLKELDTSGRCLAVAAKEQTKGRGTSGRQWMGMPGNLFLTIAIPSSRIPVIVTLLPLKLGTIVARTASRLLKECNSSSNVTVKWPNDVLVDHQKVAGVLIESEILRKESWFLVGIGVNLLHAPKVPSEGPNRGRPSTSIHDSCERTQNFVNSEDMSTAIAAEIASELVDWVHDGSGSDKNEESMKVVEEWKKWAEFGGQQELRDTENREIVVPIGIELDGQLRVRGQDGSERLLVADYLL